MVAIDKPKFNGAELIRELKKTGTAPAKLELATSLLGFINRTERRIARADEIIDAMEKAGIMPGYEQWPRTPELTLQKAIALATTGVWDGKKEVVETPLEELLLAGLPVPEPEEAPVTPLEKMVLAPDEIGGPGDNKNKMETATQLQPMSVKKKPGRPAKKPEPEPKAKPKSFGGVNSNWTPPAKPAAPPSDPFSANAPDPTSTEPVTA